VSGAAGAPSESARGELRLAAGRDLGEYRLIRPLGAGAFGEVWLARHRWLPGRRAAVKVPRAARALEQLRRDGVLQARLDAPEIVRVLGLDLDRHPPFVAYEIIDGPSLAAHLPLALGAALVVLGDVAAALAHAHGRGVLHLDLKPANVLLDPRGRAHVTDFGLAYPVCLAASGLGVPPGLATGDPLGTLEYMSPEQRAVGPLDPRADVFSFGVVLFETLTGRLPAGGERPSHIVPGLPSALDDLHARCCGPLEGRIRDGAGLKEALRRIRPAAVPGARPMSWHDRELP